MTQRLLTTAAVLVLGCGESPPHADGSTTHDVNTAACGSIGAQCNGNTCANGLECINSACASVRGDCGGFAGAACQDRLLVCTYPTGSSAGICMRQDEKDCLCAIAPTALADCMQP